LPPIVVEAFEARAKGARYQDLARLTGLSGNGVVEMLKNKAYTGIAFSGSYVNDNGVGKGALEGKPCKPTHEPLISKELARLARGD